MEASDRIDAQVWRVSLVVLVGTVMSVLDTTIVNVSLATLSRELHSTISSMQWVVTGYMLALGTVIPVTGWAGRRFGATRVYLASVVLFTIGSALLLRAERAARRAGRDLEVATDALAGLGG